MDIDMKAKDNGRGWIVEEIDGSKVETFKPVPHDMWLEFRKAVELVSQHLVFNWNREFIAIARKEWTDEELEEYVSSLNLNQKAVLYAATLLKAPAKAELLHKINELLSDRGESTLDNLQFTAVKGSLTRHSKKMGKEELIPSQFSVKDYWENEKSRYRINEKYREKLRKIFSNYFR